MLTVYKYVLSPGTDSIAMPTGAKLLHVDTQIGQRTEVCVWALVNTSAPVVRRRIHIVGTGWSIDVPAGEYVGTALIAGGEFVFHVFDRGES